MTKDLIVFQMILAISKELASVTTPINEPNRFLGGNNYKDLESEFKSIVRDASLMVAITFSILSIHKHQIRSTVQ